MKPWWQPDPLPIPRQAPNTALFAGSDGRMHMYCWYHPLDAAAEAERLLRLGYRMFVFEAVETRPVPGMLAAYELYLQGAFGAPAGTASAAIAAIGRCFPQMSFALMAK